MINLLPPILSQDIRYGRRNARLLRWLFGSLAAIAGLILIMLIGWLYMNRQSSSLAHNISESKSQLAAENLTKVQQDANEISGDVKVINQVLGREIRFSDLLAAIGQVMPPGTILGSLTLTDAKGAIDLSASAKDYASATQIAVNLGDPKNALFSKADIVNINCTTGSSAYNCTATLKALFSKSAQAKFLGVAKGAK